MALLRPTHLRNFKPIELAHADCIRGAFVGFLKADIGRQCISYAAIVCKPFAISRFLRVGFSLVTTLASVA
jgi:hypothetical protein